MYGEEFTCRVCTLIFKSHHELESHLVTHNTYHCKVCKKVFFRKKDINFHRKYSPACDATLECELCHKKFLSKETLGNHKRLIHNPSENLHRCEICGKCYNFAKQTQKHMKSVHTAYEYMECRICHRLLLGPERLKYHITSSHIDGQDASSWFPCLTCGKTFKTEAFLKTHQQTHSNKRVLCHTCGKSFKSENSMAVHIRYEHTKVGTFFCKPCNKYFSSEHKYKNHVKRSEKHTGKAPFVPIYCEICGKAYKTEQILKSHLRIHSEEKPFKCDVCGAAFKQRVTLNTHLRVHSDLKKYSCCRCGLSFKWKQTFDNHCKKCDFAESVSDMLERE